MFEPDDCLMISGLQHFKFCRRQWALIHIEQQWAENIRTTEGEIMHERRMTRACVRAGVNWWSVGDFVCFR